MKRKEKSKEPFIPPARHDTIRKEIMGILEDEPITAREISEKLRIAEKEVYFHLEHVRKSVEQSGQRLTVEPAACTDCGFRFNKRDKMKPPGRCPVCKSESIRPPSFFLGVGNRRQA